MGVLPKVSTLAAQIKEKATRCTVRECQPIEHERCLEIYRSNEGTFIAPGHIGEFTDFLSEPISYFFVVEDSGGQIVGCGGVELPAQNPELAGLTFGMIDSAHHRKGFGTSLLGARIAVLDEESVIGMETSLEAVGFYARYGFELDSVTPDRLGKGNDYGNLILDVSEDDKSSVRGALIEVGVQIQLSEE